MMAELDGKFCTLPEGKTTSISVFPVALQVCGNTFGKGLEKIGFETKDGRFIVSFFEGDDIISVPVGFSDYEKTEIKLGELPFRVAVHGRFAENEDYLPVLKIKLGHYTTSVRPFIIPKSRSACKPYFMRFSQDGLAVIPSEWYNRRTGS